MKLKLLLLAISIMTGGCALLTATPPGFYNSRGNYNGCSYPCHIGTDGKYHYDGIADNENIIIYQTED